MSGGGSGSGSGNDSSSNGGGSSINSGGISINSSGSGGSSMNSGVNSSNVNSSVGRSSSGASAGGQHPSRAPADNRPPLASQALIAHIEAGDVAALLPALLYTHPDAADRRKRTLLMHATVWGHVEVVCVLLCTGGCDVNRRNLSGWSALHYAAHHGWLDVLYALLANGADVNASDFWGKTPLMLAAAEGQLHVVTALVAAGADVSLTNDETADALARAIAKGHEDVVAALLNAGADVNSNARLIGTPLMQATRFGKSSTLLQLLLSRGADPSLPTALGYTPMAWAKFVRNRPAYEVMQQAGAKMGPCVAEALSYLTGTPGVPGLCTDFQVCRTTDKSLPGLVSLCQVRSSPVTTSVRRVCLTSRSCPCFAHRRRHPG